MTQADRYYLLAQLPNTSLRALLEIRKFAKQTDNALLVELVERHPTLKSLKCSFGNKISSPKA